MSKKSSSGHDKIQFLKNFPKVHKQIKGVQRRALMHDEAVQGSNIQELPTGTGKTAKGYTDLLAMQEFYGDGTYFYITPNKNLVDQIKATYKEFHVVYGRNEYDCLYYEEPQYKADQVPCSLLTDCYFRVDFDTGKTHEPGVTPCPYLHAKWKAKNKLIVCTMSFYLFTVFFSDQWGEINGVVVDEAHKMPDVIRGALSYEISNRQLENIVGFLKDHKLEGEKEVTGFQNLMKKAVTKHGKKYTLLSDQEIFSFIDQLTKIKKLNLEYKVSQAIRQNRIADDQRDVIKKVETLTRNLHKYITSFEYSLDTNKRRALNYTYGYFDLDNKDPENLDYSLHIRCYQVASIIKRIFPENKTFYLSATIGDIDTFRLITGLNCPFFAHESEFPVSNTRIYLPTDIENLSMAKAQKRSKPKTIRRIARTCRLFADRGHRSLVLVVSDQERETFRMMAEEEKVLVVTYGEGLKPKDAVQLFKEGYGDVLLGTFAHYGEGIDLPDQMAPVTFALRPAYAPPGDPMALYEEHRYKNRKWRLWDAREMQRILQARGRNIRSEKDKGVTFCMSKQYGNIVLKSLPKWLQPAYVHSKTFYDCVKDALALLDG